MPASTDRTTVAHSLQGDTHKGLAENVDAKNSFDYIVVGSGCAGSALASRLSERYPGRSVLLVEAGPNPSYHPLVPQPLVAPMLRGSELDWKYESTLQPHLGNRAIYEAAGKALGGGSVINYGLWTRGDTQDYHNWAKLSGSDRWSYDGLLPYFRKSENHYNPKVDPKHYSAGGPIPLVSTKSTGRLYPLRDLLASAWMDAGVERIADPNSGSPLGIGDAIECRQNLERVIASDVYNLKGVQVLTETLVSRVLIEDVEGTKTATGVELANGHHTLRAEREVILSGGAIHTPKILMLSGIGPSGELSRHGIPQTVDAPCVGRNLFNHMNVKQFWKLRHPELGASFGHPEWKNPAYKGANPLDYIVCQTVQGPKLKAALAEEDPNATDDHPLLTGDRCHVETFVQYAAVSKANPEIKPDGSHIQSVVLNMLPTSRGNVRLKSGDPNELPVVDTNYFATDYDRHVIRQGLRKVHQVLLETPAGQEMVVEEAHGDDVKPLSSKSTDEEIDARVIQGAQSTSHPAGTAAMGTVLDANLKVKGVNGLRVCDASAFPSPVAAHPMAALYAMAEQLAELID
ncbi:MAG: hypothetical protein Q9217_005280 [Psora testacea]